MTESSRDSAFCPLSSVVCLPTSAQPDLFERLADPGILILVRLAAGGLEEAIGVLLPGAIREIVAEHGGGGLRLADDAQRDIGFGQPPQRFLYVGRGLGLRHHDLSAG